MEPDLIKRLQNNHEVLVAKIVKIESMIAEPKNSTTNKTISGDTGVESSQDEQQRLLVENQKLRNEIQRLVKRLTELEIKAKGNSDDICSLNSLQDKSTVQAGDSSSSPPKQAQTTTTKPTSEPAKKSQETKPQTANKKEKNKEKKPEASKQPTNDADAKPPKEPSKPKPDGDKAKAAASGDLPINASRLDLRVGKIIKVEKHPDADTLYVEQIDCGESKPRTVVSGLVKFVPMEQMQDRMVVILCNLKPAKMRGVVSEAMVMCASTPEKVEILSPPVGSMPGDRVTFGQYPGQPDAQLNPKKKIWEQIAPDLKTNDSLEATYKGDPFVVDGKGPVKAETLKNVQVK